MAEDIHFALVTSDNLKLKNFKMHQVEVGITVEGADDPVVHQLMRDAVRPLFKSYQAALNQHIVSIDKEIARESKRPNKEKVLKRGVTGVTTIANKFKDKAQAELDAFCRKEKEKQAKLEEAERAQQSYLSWENVKYVCWMVWPAAKVVVDSTAGYLSGSEAVSGDLLKVKGALENFKKAYGSFKELLDRWAITMADLDGARTLTESKLKLLKSAKSVVESQVNAARDMIDVFENKLTKYELETRALVKKVDEVLKSIPKGEAISPASVSTTAKTFCEVLDAIGDQVQTIKKTEAKIAKMRKDLVIAKQKVKNEPKTVLDYFGSFFDGFVDMKDYFGSERKITDKVKVFYGLGKNLVNFFLDSEYVERGLEAFGQITLPS